MKILHILDYHPDYHFFYGGAEIATLRLVNELTKKNIENFMLITLPDKKNIRVNNIFILKTIYNYINFKNLKSVRNKILSNIDFYKIIFPFDFIVFWNSRKILKKLQPDIIHFNNFKKLSFSILLWAKFFKIPTVLTIYDYWFFCPNETLLYKNKYICKKYHGYSCYHCFKIPLRFRLFLLFRKYFFNFFLKKIDSYIFLSKSSMQIGKIYGLHSKKMTVIPQIFENPPDVSNAIPKDNIILYIGWIQYRKGLHILIEALDKMLKEINDITLYIIGEIKKVEQQYVNEVIKKINEKGLTKHIIIKGKLPHEEIKEYFKIAKVIAIPEQWENMSPVVLVEAMFNKKGIVASRIGGIEEFIEDGKDGFLCDPKDPNEFAEKILKLLNNNELLQFFGNNAYKKAMKTWDNEKNIEEIIKLYKGLKK